MFHVVLSHAADWAGWCAAARAQALADIPEANIERGNWLSNQVLTSYENLLDHCCRAWSKLVDQPWTIISSGLRDWTYRF